MKKSVRLLSLLIVLCMLLGVLPAAALADSNPLPFKDVGTRDWFYDAVSYVYEKGIMGGTGSDAFSPNLVTSRGMIVTILYRIEGRPAAEGENFTDVKANAYYADAVSWASANGIVSGYGSGKFGPDDAITREQLAAILYRYAAYQGRETGVSSDLTAFADADQVSGYAETALCWAVENGLISGMGDGMLAPGGSATRAQTAAILMRYLEETVQEPEEAPAEKPVVPQTPMVTVTFESNGGSEVPSQTIQKGECLKSFTPPVRNNYTLVGWYSDPKLTAAFDLGTPVVQDMTLYAKWEGRDDFEDEDSTDAANKEYVLSTDAMDVEAGKKTVISFHVNTQLTISAGFELFEDGVSTGVKLYDDGDSKQHHDDIPNDGCYSGQYTFQLDEEREVLFTARAAVGDQTITTNSVRIFVYQELTDDQVSSMEMVDQGVSTAMKQVRDQNPDASEEELVPLLKKAVESFLKEQEKAGTIKNIVYHEESAVFSWEDVQTGIVSTVFLTWDTDPGTKGRSAEPAAQMAAAGSGQTNVTLDTKYSCGRVKILNAYGANNVWSIQYDELATMLRNAGFEVDTVYDMKCSDFRGLQDYDSMVLLDSHGNTLDGTKSGQVMICTEEVVSKSRDKFYSADLKQGRINRVTLKSGRRYWINPKFFKDWYSSEELSGPIVYLGACRQYPVQENNTSMVKAWKEAGASAVCGYNASVFVPYDQAMNTSLVEELLKGKDVGAAVAAAKKQNGAEDTYGTDTDWGRKAVLNIYGSEKAELYHSLRNGMFEEFSLFNWLGMVRGWEEYGDTRVIYKLSGLLPTEKKHMGIISSGFGSKNEATTSAIYQTILVPEDAYSLSFDYDVVSEEPMEFVNTKYDDIFSVEFLKPDGTPLEQLEFESVNTSTWYQIQGVNFPGGDDTTYHTRWSTCESNAISKYRGQLIVVQFAVRDAGDSIYDTAVLVDNIRIK